MRTNVPLKGNNRRALEILAESPLEIKAEFRDVVEREDRYFEFITHEDEVLVPKGKILINPYIYTPKRIYVKLSEEYIGPWSYEGSFLSSHYFKTGDRDFPIVEVVGCEHENISDACFNGYKYEIPASEESEGTEDELKEKVKDGVHIATCRV